MNRRSTMTRSVGGLFKLQSTSQREVTPGTCPDHATLEPNEKGLGESRLQRFSV